MITYSSEVAHGLLPDLLEVRIVIFLTLPIVELHGKAYTFYGPSVPKVTGHLQISVLVFKVRSNLSFLLRCEVYTKEPLLDLRLGQLHNMLNYFCY